MRRVDNQAGGQQYRESLSYNSVDECEQFCEQTESCVAAVFYSSFSTCVWFDDRGSFSEEQESQAIAIFKECQDRKLVYFVYFFMFNSDKIVSLKLKNKTKKP